MCNRIVILGRKQISSRVLEQIASYRYRIFIEELGWTLPADHERKLELDAFDHSEDVHYLVVYQDGDLIGTARLTPATQPNVSRDIFSTLFEAQGSQAFVGSWEISRMAVTPTGAEYSRSQIVLDMLAVIQAFAATRGAARLIGVTFSQVIRKYRECGLNIVASGREIICDDVPTSGFYMSIEPTHTQNQNPAFGASISEAA